MLKLQFYGLNQSKNGQSPNEIFNNIANEWIQLQGKHVTKITVLNVTYSTTIIVKSDK